MQANSSTSLEQQRASSSTATGAGATRRTTSACLDQGSPRHDQPHPLAERDLQARLPRRATSGAFVRHYLDMLDRDDRWDEVAGVCGRADPRPDPDRDQQEGRLPVAHQGRYDRGLQPRSGWSRSRVRQSWRRSTACPAALLGAMRGRRFPGRTAELSGARSCLLTTIVHRWCPPGRARAAAPATRSPGRPGDPPPRAAPPRTR